jgi:hypothetical protein
MALADECPQLTTGLPMGVPRQNSVRSPQTENRPGRALQLHISPRIFLPCFCSSSFSSGPYGPWHSRARGELRDRLQLGDDALPGPPGAGGQLRAACLNRSLNSTFPYQPRADLVSVLGTVTGSARGPGGVQVDQVLLHEAVVWLSGCAAGCAKVNHRNGEQRLSSDFGAVAAAWWRSLVPPPRATRRHVRGLRSILRQVRSTADWAAEDGV